MKPFGTSGLVEKIWLKKLIRIKGFGTKALALAHFCISI
jgi:hypothetical protein